MRLMKIAIVVAMVAGLGVSAVAKKGMPITFDNRLRLEYDDNIRQESKDDADASVKIVEQLQLIGEINADNTFISLRYQPSYVYWFDRPESDSNVHHSMDMLINQRFSQRLSAAISDRLRYSELSELRATDDSDLVIRPDNTYLYNKVNGAMTYRMTADWKLRANAAYEFVTYDENDVANREDYDKMIYGIDLENALTKKTTAGAQLRYDDISYDNSAPPVVEGGQQVDRGFGNRDSEQIQVGGLLQQVFSPNLIGNVRAGYSVKDYKAAATDDSTAPYVSGSATLLPSPKTRMTVGGSYSLYDANLYPYVGQTRTSVYASIGQDITAKTDFYVSATYIMGKYESDEVVDTVAENAPIGEYGGDDNSSQVSARLRYNIYRQNYLELGYQFTDVDSEVRRDYSRNRYWVGWQTRL